MNTSELQTLNDEVARLYPNTSPSGYCRYTERDDDCNALKQSLFDEGFSAVVKYERSFVVVRLTRPCCDVRSSEPVCGNVSYATAERIAWCRAAVAAKE